MISREQKKLARFFLLRKIYVNTYNMKYKQKLILDKYKQMPIICKYRHLLIKEKHERKFVPHR